MDSDRFARVKELFEAAASMHGAEREAFLESLDTSDAALRAEIERLLAQETSEGGLTEIRAHVARAVSPEGAPSLEVGDTITHYRLVEKLGEGGMGSVFLAEDVALGRRTAIKVLRETHDEMFRARLVREAWASARLQHPAIAAFYESGEAEDGTTYLAMEYVPGTTLRARLKRGPLAPEAALDVAAGLLEGLIHAHESGVLHRDIKPENIVLTGERSAKLLDFGLARQIVEEWPEADSSESEVRTVTRLSALTAHGAVAGTLGYMSPEQLRGEPVDARTDVFALGAVIHEMLTGRPAFGGADAQERMAAVLSKDPEPVRGPGLPAEVAPILRKAMARDRDARYASAVELLRDLRRVRDGETLGVLPETLAVLDLRNVSGDPDDAWIGSGIAESLTADLRRVSGLVVVARDRVARTVAAKASEGDVDPRGVGLALGCRWVLDGTVQRMGPALRITTNLRDVATGDVVSSEKVDGRVDEVFTMQDRLSEAVAGSLHLESASHASAPDVDAFEEYTRGKQEWQTFERGAMDRGRERMERALEADPSFAPALAGLAGYYAMQFLARADRTALDLAVDHARRALAIDEGEADAHTWLGYALWRQGRNAEAIEEFRRAEQLDPSLHMPAYFLACVHMEEGEPALSAEAAQRCYEICPTYNNNVSTLGTAQLLLGHHEAALWLLGRAFEAEKRGAPPSMSAVGLAHVHRVIGEIDQAESVAREAIEITESRDHMIRDLSRCMLQLELGRVMLAKDDVPAAQIAFGQARLQVEGRSHLPLMGHLAVQALCGLGATGDAEAYDRGRRLFEVRAGYDFSWGGFASDLFSRIEIARAAIALGRLDDARAVLALIADAHPEARRMRDEIDR